MANNTFPANSWASGLTLIDANQALYQDTSGYYYQDSGDGKTIYDLGTDSYIDYNAVSYTHLTLPTNREV